MASDSFQLVRRTPGALPRLPFASLKDAVLGKAYALELSFVDTGESRRLNQRYRAINSPANVLSFPLSRESGQIVICPATARRQAPRYLLSPRAFIAYLFIHGMLHLKGLRHGSKMESEERRWLERFVRSAAAVKTSHGKKNIRRHRRRNTPGQGHGRRRDSAE